MSGSRRSYQEPPATIANTGTLGGNLTDLSFTDQANAAAAGGWNTAQISEQGRFNTMARLPGAGTISSSTGIVIAQNGTVALAEPSQIAPVGFTVVTGIAANGTLQSGATVLTASANIVTTASAGNTAVKFGVIGSPQELWNLSTLALSVFPTGSYAIVANGTTLAVNAAASVPPGSHVRTLQEGLLCLTAP